MWTQYDVNMLAAVMVFGGGMAAIYFFWLKPEADRLQHLIDTRKKKGRPD